MLYEPQLEIWVWSQIVSACTRGLFLIWAAHKDLLLNLVHLDLLDVWFTMDG